MKKLFGKLVCSLTLLGMAATTTAQSTFNYFITPAGGSNSRVIWSVTGNLTAVHGAVWTVSGPQFGGVPIQTSGIFNVSYTGTSFPQTISNPDGSFYQNMELGQNFAINLYYAGVSGSTDTFGLLTSPATTAMGQHLTYHADSQSEIIPIPYSDFNVGSYQSTFVAGSFFDTPVTVNLTVGAVPEPSSLALTILGGLGLLMKFIRRKNFWRIRSVP